MLDAFVIEAEVDSVQLSLHAGVASCDDSDEADAYCAAWGANMTAALAQVADRARDDPARAGLFAAACYMHTTFKATGPTIGGRSYVDALGDWLLRPGGAAGSVSEDACCANGTAVVTYNPTC